MLRMLLVSVAVLLAATVCVAQGPMADNPYRWAISGYVGANFGGPSGDLEDSMRANGFDATVPPGFFGSAQPRPETDTDVSWMVIATGYVRSSLSISALYGNTNFGRTKGYHADAQGLIIGSSTDIIAAFLSYNNTSFLSSLLEEDIFLFRCGAGPALYLIKSDPESTNTVGVGSDETKLGFLIDLGLQAPAGRRLFVEVNGQYRWTGSVDVGPLTARSLDLSETATLPKTTVSFNHFFFGGGVGVRL